MRIVFKADGSAIGLQMGGGPLVFAPFDPQLSLRLLEGSRLGVRYQQEPDGLVLADADAS